MSIETPKGYSAEEACRIYFLSLGYYVVRGAKFKLNFQDGTDIDLWLFGKSSSLSRERINVDIKNKKSPQAVERIFWTKGIQSSLGYDQCIVITTEGRIDIRDFGEKIGVKVLGGTFINRLISSQKSISTRLSEEDFLKILFSKKMKSVYEDSKSRLLSNLSFDGLNMSLNDLKYSFELIASERVHSNQNIRFMYAILSHLLVSLDYILSRYVDFEAIRMDEILSDGIKYGDSGKIFADKIMAVLTQMHDRSTKSKLCDEFNQMTAVINSKIISEFISSRSVINELFNSACLFEKLAFSNDLIPIHELNSSMKSLICVLLDFHNIERRYLIN